jgi:hypothetical protein
MPSTTEKVHDRPFSYLQGARRHLQVALTEVQALQELLDQFEVDDDRATVTHLPERIAELIEDTHRLYLAVTTPPSDG